MKECLSCHNKIENMSHTCPKCGCQEFVMSGSIEEVNILAEAMSQQQEAAKHIDQSLLYYNQQRYDEAENELKIVLELNPMNSIASGIMGDLLLRLGRPREALPWFEKALQLNPGHPTAGEALEKARKQVEVENKTPINPSSTSTKTGNWKPGEKAPRSGTYMCIYCGPEGMNATVLKKTMENMGIPFTPSLSAMQIPPRIYLKEGESFPSCSNCKEHIGGIDPTGWGFVSEKEVNTTVKPLTNSHDIEYFECTRPAGDGLCSDDACPCGYQGTNIPRGGGYLYISKEVVEMRRDARSIADVQAKVYKIQQTMSSSLMLATNGVFMPILMCEQGAKQRKIDLVTAAADARYYWETGLAPLRPTPIEGGKGIDSKVIPTMVSNYQPQKGYSVKPWRTVALIAILIMGLLISVLGWSFWRILSATTTPALALGSPAESTLSSLTSGIPVNSNELSTTAQVYNSPPVNTLADTPTFKAKSLEPVLLRYKFTVGQKKQFNLKMLMNVLGEAQNEKLVIRMDMGLWGNYVVTRVDPNGDAQLSFVLTRITLSATGPRTVTFDSDRSYNQPEYESMMVMLNKPVTGLVTPQGALKNMDDHLIVDAVNKISRNVMPQNSNQISSQMLNNTFIQLWRDPVKEGDVYPAGDIIQPADNFGQMKMQTSYKLMHVSGDRKQVLLQPMASIKLLDNPSSPVKVTLDEGSINGWILFDIEKGDIQRSRAIVLLGMTIMQDGVPVKVQMSMDLKYQTEEVVGIGQVVNPQAGNHLSTFNQPTWPQRNR